MSTWSRILFVPDEQAVAEAADAWRWLIPEPWTIIFSSMFGGLFLEKQTGGAFWLECGTGMIERVADSASDLNAFLGGPRDEVWDDRVDEWFLPGFVQTLHDAGKVPGTGECYGLTILPIFKGGTYTVDNAFVVPVREWLSLTGSMHEQMRDVPDGAQVRIQITD